jgi:cytochrome c553
MELKFLVVDSNRRYTEELKEIEKKKNQLNAMKNLNKKLSEQINL